jgi:hypothetical protein
LSVDLPAFADLPGLADLPAFADLPAISRVHILSKRRGGESDLPSRAVPVD